jgi:hypothetical protein
MKRKTTTKKEKERKRKTCRRYLINYHRTAELMLATTHPEEKGDKTKCWRQTGQECQRHDITNTKNVSPRRRRSVNGHRYPKP